MVKESYVENSVSGVDFTGSDFTLARLDYKLINTNFFSC